MRSVSDNGATAPISALIYAFSIGSNRGDQAAGFGPESCMRSGHLDTYDGSCMGIE